MDAALLRSVVVSVRVVAKLERIVWRGMGIDVMGWFPSANINSALVPSLSWNVILS